MGTLEMGVYGVLPLFPELVEDEGLHLFRRRPEEHLLEVGTLLADAESAAAAVGLVDAVSAAAAVTSVEAVLESAEVVAEVAPAPARLRFRKLPTIFAIFP